MKFLVPNYSCLQNPWLRGYHPQIPVLSVLNWICWTPPRKKFLGTPLLLHTGLRTCLVRPVDWQRYRRLFRKMALKMKEIRYFESTDTPNTRKGLNFQFHRCFEEGETYIISVFLPFLAGRKTNQETAGPATEPPLHLPNTNERAP